MYKRLARFSLLGILILTVFSGTRIAQLEFDYDFESFFPAEDTDRTFYEAYRQKFEPDNDFVLIAIESENGVFNSPFLTTLDSLTQRLSRLDNVHSVLSPTNAKNMVMDPLGIAPPFEVSFIHVDQPELYEKDSIRVFKTEWLKNTLLSADRQSVCVVMQTAPNLSKAASDDLVYGIDAELARLELNDVHLSGRIEGQNYFIEKMQWEMAIFMVAGLTLLILFLWVAFRSLWGIWVPILVVMLAAAWLLAFMQITGKNIDLMVTLLPTILFVVGMSDVVHILSRYLEELRNGRAKFEAIRIAFREVGMATFLTSLTTAVGFFTLTTSGTKPIQDFGFYTGIGVFLAFILAFTLLPSLLVFFKKPRIAEQKNDGLFWFKQMHQLFGWVIRHRKLVLAGGVVLVAVSLWGVSYVKVDSFLLGDLSDDDPHKQDFIFFEEQFSGVRPFEMSVRVKDTTTNILSYEVMAELKKVEDYLKEEYGVGFITSPLSLIKSSHQAMNDGLPEYYTMPESEKRFRRIKRVIERLRKRPAFRTFITEDLMEGRISGKMTDLGGHRIAQLDEKMAVYLAENINHDLLEFRQTGMAMLIDKNNSMLSSNMMFGLLIAFGVIALIMGFLYRSISIILVSLVPNVLPLLVIGAYMGFMGIDLQISTSIIFTIAFGIAVDDTIHYMSKLRLELNKGKSLPYALKRTSISTGKAITVTTIILISGFVTLLISTFSSTYYVGLLISITLIVAVISDLFLLPVLLVYFFKPKKKR